jgi:5-formyltetrahydrofolate cyclo-ligase
VDSISQAKRTLREEFRKDRALRFIPESWLHLLKAREIQAAQIVASYFSYGFEPETADINAGLLGLGKVLLLPRTLKDRSLEWVEWDGRNKSLRKRGPVFEPIGVAFTELQKIDVVIVPALHIDSQGNRIGQGGGSYDRALAQLSSWKVGLVGTGELSNEEFPVESHDQKVDAAATPQLLLRFSRGTSRHS